MLEEIKQKVRAYQQEKREESGTDTDIIITIYYFVLSLSIRTSSPERPVIFTISLSSKPSSTILRAYSNFAS